MIVIDDDSHIWHRHLSILRAAVAPIQADV